MNNSIQGRKSRAMRSGLKLPIGRIHRYLRNGNFARRIGGGAPIYLAAVVEYLVIELIDAAATYALENKKKRITTRFLNFAIRNDNEMGQLLSKVHISNGGVFPYVNPVLLR